MHGRKESPLRFYLRRYGRLLPPFLALMALYCLKDCVLARKISLTDFCSLVLHGPYKLYLWYVYLLVGIYAALPLFRVLFASRHGLAISKSLVAVWLVLAVLAPQVARLAPELAPAWLLPLLHSGSDFLSYTGYALIGGLLRNAHLPPRLRPWLFPLYLLASILIFAATVLLSRAAAAPRTAFLEYASPLVLIQSLALFLALRDLPRASGLIKRLSALSYWIYLLHIPVLVALLKITPLKLERWPLLSIPLTAGLALVLSGLLACPLYLVETKTRRLFAGLESGKQKQC